MDFQAKTFLYNVIFYQTLMLFNFSKISYVLLYFSTQSLLMSKFMKAKGA